MIVNTIYNVVDRIFIGQFAGEEAITGLTIAFLVMMMLLACAYLVGTGGAALLSINLGKKRYSKHKPCIWEYVKCWNNYYTHNGINYAF